MKEIVSLHIGGAGIQLGTDIWKFISHQHQISSDGYISDHTISQAVTQNQQNFRNFYLQSTAHKLTPIAAHFDLDRQSIDKVRYGEYRHLFNTSNMLSGKEDSGNNCARAYMNLGPQMIDLYIDRVRNILQKCDCPQSFLLYHSLGGGTGSGITSLILESLSTQFGKMNKLCFPVISDPQQCKIIVQPYNTVVGLAKIQEHAEITIPLQNSAAIKMLKNNFGGDHFDYNKINKLFARNICEITTNMRNNCALNTNVQQCITNLIPYPSFKFLHSSLGSLIPHGSPQPTLVQLSLALYQKQNSFMDFSPRAGKFMASSIYYRGQQLSPKNVNIGFIQLKTGKNPLKFIDWSPTGVKVGINYHPRAFLPGQMLAQTKSSTLALSNTTAMKSFYEHNLHKFNQIFKLRTFIHWFQNQGMVDDFFLQWSQGLEQIVGDYIEAQKEQEQGQQQQG